MFSELDYLYTVLELDHASAETINAVNTAIEGLSIKVIDFEECVDTIKRTAYCISQEVKYKQFSNMYTVAKEFLAVAEDIETNRKTIVATLSILPRVVSRLDELGVIDAIDMQDTLAQLIEFYENI